MSQDQKYEGFDSKLVRLKGLGLSNATYEFARFRFQTGSIKSIRLSEAGSHLWGFDSKLVRLKGFMKTVSILYAILVLRVKPIFKNCDF